MADPAPRCPLIIEADLDIQLDGQPVRVTSSAQALQIDIGGWGALLRLALSSRSRGAGKQMMPTLLEGSRLTGIDAVLAVRGHRIGTIRAGQTTGIIRFLA